MCLAIVKPKGVPISEEHLQNGWGNNDDGAGFVCITNEGEFFIHKSMTYEGFINVYREKVEQYGDTSDFLIHFRITSKGKTTIDNCHPFVVDSERVIIHNGTMYNVGISKNDSRSDTKVFAEDWLSQLPDNWEDNKIICLMLEDFISTGKICMLHKTKGIYIFNEDKGYWVDGVWYSNKSYEKILLLGHNNIGFNNRNNTTNEYDNDDGWENWSRWGDASERQWIKCDNCGEYDQFKHMIDMHGDHANEKWCWDCYKNSVACDNCGKKFDEKDVDEYYNPQTGELITLCDDCENILHHVLIDHVASPPEQQSNSK